MKYNNFYILFYLSRSKTNKKGLSPLKCRITYNSKRKEFASGYFVNSIFWDATFQRLTQNDDDSIHVNNGLNLIKSKLNKSFLFLEHKGTKYDVNDIYSDFIGESLQKERTLLEVLEIHNNRMKNLVGKEYAPKYYQKYLGTYILIQDFIKRTYQKNDILLNKLTLKFLDDLDYYSKVHRGHKQVTINKLIQRIRKIINLAISEGFLEKDPFILYKPKRVVKEIVYLNEEELKLLKNYSFSQVRLEQVRDMFIFCCYTGLAYQEMSNLNKDNLIKGFDGQLWIEMYRKKTKKQFSLPLLKQAKEILNKYESLLAENKLLPIITNQKFNSYLKEIAEIVGINKKLTHHVARKTFATTVLLYNDIPMEIVSELLGHSKITVTQEHYAKVVKKKVSEHMKKLRTKLKE